MPKSTINSDLVRQLAALLDETGLTEIEYESGAVRLRVARQPAPVAAAPVAAPAAAMPAAAPATAAPAPDARHPGAVTSPMVGTVYTAAEPGTPEFVKPGDRVREGQTLLLIEAMKTFNEIRAPRAGTVSLVLVQNEQPVEYGDVLLILE
ncbi:MAG TPA: acetyl-CoA carboxylase biotin carboxyl carrier protein subunit [Alphaproteobacteria bacterium]|jgi:acetyl-CoA carboxylase biotin carboxyl carrier protein|nr:acetyl-CoA carboxylase biotin carboxyl carrier protein subunit [Alphaproteobacteria bacterium]